MMTVRVPKYICRACRQNKINKKAWVHEYFTVAEFGLFYSTGTPTYTYISRGGLRFDAILHPLSGSSAQQ